LIIAVIAIVLQRYFWYFACLAIGFGLWFAFNRIVIKKFAAQVPVFSMILGSKLLQKVASAGSAVLLFIFALSIPGSHYLRAVDRANLSSDKIIAIEDGSPVNLYRSPPDKYGRFSGKPAAVLTVGETVDILGANRSRTAFKVRTENKKTGYITRKALRSDVMPSPFSVMGKAFGGSSTSGAASITREQERLRESMAAVMPAINTLLVPVGVSSEPKDKDGNGIDWFWGTVKAIAYLEDFTVVQFESDEFDIGTDVWDFERAGNHNNDTWYVEDADTKQPNSSAQNGTGFTYTEYHLLGHEEYRTGRGKTGQYLFFRPFKTKHFNLISKNRSYGEDNRKSGEHIMDVRVP
jgi:hypothetical protein